MKKEVMSNGNISGLNGRQLFFSKCGYGGIGRQE
jgi:hypothetical protein